MESSGDPDTHGAGGQALIRRLTDYLRVRPRSVGERIELYRAYIVTVGWRVTRRQAPGGPGQFLRRAIRVECGGGTIEVRAHSDDLEYTITSTKAALNRWFRPRNGDHVADVGAHIGCNSVSALIQGAHVLAMEPNPSNFEALRRNVELNGSANSVLVCAAAGSVEGIAQLRVPLLAKGFGSFKADWVDEEKVPPESPVQRVPVKVVTLDSAIGATGWARIDWLLIDAEGSELEVLGGAREALAITKHLIIEVDKQAGNDVAVEAHLVQEGFRLDERYLQTARTEYWLLRSGKDH